MCHLKGGLAIECGDAGIGKTMACKKYAEDYPATAIYVSVNPCLVTLSAFLKLLCRTQKITASGRKDEMWLRLADSFEGERKVLIIDEAQHLPIKTIEAIRAFFDSNPLLGICLVGNIETVTNTGKSKEAFAQIRNRTKLTEVRHTSAIKSSDIELLFPAIKSDERAVNFLLGVSRSEQGIRGASNVFGNAVDNGNITYEGLIAIIFGGILNVVKKNRVTARRRVQHGSSNDRRIRSNGYKELYSRRRNLLCAYGAPACMGRLDDPWRKPKGKKE